MPSRPRPRDRRDRRPRRAHPAPPPARLLLPAIIAALVAGHLSLLAHVLGYSSIVGRLSDGSYFVSKLTVLLALILPLPPIVAPTCIAYLVLRGRMREAWARDHVARGLPAEVAARNAH